MITLQKKKKFCIKYINNIDINKRISIMKILKMKTDSKFISEQADGTRIFLDELNEDLINDIYSIIKNTL